MEAGNNKNPSTLPTTIRLTFGLIRQTNTGNPFPVVVLKIHLPIYSIYVYNAYFITSTMQFYNVGKFVTVIVLYNIFNCDIYSMLRVCVCVCVWKYLVFKCVKSIHISIILASVDSCNISFERIPFMYI